MKVICFVHNEMQFFDNHIIFQIIYSVHKLNWTTFHLAENFTFGIFHVHVIFYWLA